ncbi:MAG: hypothetical protein ACLVB1_12085 [Blautia obeum]
MRVDADDFARPCGDGKMHHEIKEILIEPGAVNALEEAMSEGFLKEYISPLLICDTNTCKATEKLMEDIFDRCQVLVLDADDLQADQHAIEIVENYMDEDIDLILLLVRVLCTISAGMWLFNIKFLLFVPQQQVLKVLYLQKQRWSGMVRKK